MMNTGVCGECKVHAEDRVCFVSLGDVVFSQYDTDNNFFLHAPTTEWATPHAIRMMAGVTC